MIKPIKILVVDDTPDILGWISRLMSLSGYRVLTASTGAECLEIVSVERPDLILLDVVMPDIDGIEVCRRIKSNPELAHILIVHITAHRTTSFNKVQGLEAGADGYITKPVEPDALLAQVRAMVRIKQVEETLRSYVRQQAAIARLSQQALANLSLKELMNQAVITIVETLQVEFGLLQEILPSRLLDRAGVGWQSAAIDLDLNETNDINVANSPAEFRLLLDAPIIIENLKTEDRFQLDPRLIQHGITSGLIVMVAGTDLPFGSLAVYDKEARKFTQDDINFLQAIANVLSMAIERERTEQQQRQLQDERDQLLERWQQQIDRMPIGYLLHDENFNFTYWNPAAEKIFGYAKDEVIGRHPDELIVPADLQTVVAEIYQRLKAGDMTANAICENIRKDQRRIVCEWHNTPLTSPNGKFIGLMSMAQDITERKRSEEKIREQAALLDITRDAILVCDLNDQLLYWNRGAVDIYGWTAAEVLGCTIGELIYDEALQTTDKSLAGIRADTIEKGEWSGELNQRTKSGRTITVDSRWTLVLNEGQADSLLIVNTDITETKKLESQFLRVQRMESLGTLAGGIAHDLNNVLAPMLLSIQVLRNLAGDEKSRRILTTLEESALRGAGMVKQVLSFARGSEGARVELQPGELIQDVKKMLIDTLPKSVQIETSLPESLWVVKGDSTQLFQVLMNLCVNARDAMTTGGLLRIEAENIELDELLARKHYNVKPGDFVLIKVVDTGMGIAPAIIDRIFDPFFTTKELNQGTGLGLSTVLGIVQGHGGFIDVYSELDRGTVFKVYLPAERQAAKTAPTATTNLPAGAGELILIVDDEAPIREITRATLEDYGYQVLTAADGTEAVALYAAKRQEIRVVITDMMMPYMDGVATIRALRKMNPNVAIIAASGLVGSNEAMSELSNVEHFLAKPYNADRLLTVLAEILGHQR